MSDREHSDGMLDVMVRSGQAFKRKGRAWLARDCKAVTALEYGIVASILGLVLVGIFTSFGKTLTTLFSHVATSI